MNRRIPLDELRKAIDAQGRRIDWLAGRVRVSEAHLSNILAGRRALTDEHARRLADALQVPIDWIQQRPVPAAEPEPDTEPAEVPP